jgi:hypothetical protein
VLHKNRDQPIHNRLLPKPRRDRSRNGIQPLPAGLDSEERGVDHKRGGNFGEIQNEILLIY